MSSVHANVFNKKKKEKNSCNSLKAYIHCGSKILKNPRKFFNVLNVLKLSMLIFSQILYKHSIFLILEWEIMRVKCLLICHSKIIIHGFTQIASKF